MVTEYQPVWRDFLLIHFYSALIIACIGWASLAHAENLPAGTNSPVIDADSSVDTSPGATQTPTVLKKAVLDPEPTAPAATRNRGLSRWIGKMRDSETGLTATTLQVNPPNYNSVFDFKVFDLGESNAFLLLRNSSDNNEPSSEVLPTCLGIGYKLSF